MIICLIKGFISEAAAKCPLTYIEISPKSLHFGSPGVTFCCPNTSSHSMFLEMLCACCVEIVCYIFISLHWIGSLMLGSYLDALANNLSLSLYIYTHTCIHKKLSRSFLIFSFFFFLGCVFSAPSLCWICKSSEFYHYYNFECCWQVKWVFSPWNEWCSNLSIV